MKVSTVSTNFLIILCYANLASLRGQGSFKHSWIERHYKPYEPIKKVIRIQNDLTELKKHYFGRMIRLLPLLKPMKLGTEELVEEPKPIRKNLHHLRFLIGIWNL